MLKVVVYDGGWGGEVVADYLGRELAMLEIVRVIDWAHVPYDGCEMEKVVELAEANLEQYFGKVAAIVLGGYVVSMALEILRERHPEQVFVGLGVNYERILRARNYPENVVILTDQVINASELRQEIREKLMYSTLILPDCSGWEDLINKDLMTERYLREDLGQDFYLAKNPRRKQKVLEPNTVMGNDKRALLAAINRMESLANSKRQENEVEIVDGAEERTKYRPDVVLLLNTHFWGIRQELEEIFGWKVRVLDFREKLLRDVCSALNLRGVDGKRSK